MIDGGNSYYRDDLKHAKTAVREGDSPAGLRHQRRGVGPRARLLPDDRRRRLRLRARRAAVRHHRTRSRLGAAHPGPVGEIAQPEKGYLHCGPSGAGHFVKMVHNGIEYGMMASLAEGLNILRNADIGKRVIEAGDAETAPLSNPECYQYDFDIADVAEVWRRGSVVGSWLLDLTAIALHESPDLHEFSGRVSDSGEGRWTAIAAIDEGVPAPVLTTALQSRFASRSLDDFANKALSAMRKQFGGHAEKPADGWRADA